MITVTTQDGRQIKGDLLVVFDENTKHYHWRHWSPQLDIQTPYILNRLSPMPTLFSSIDCVSWWDVAGMAITVRTSNEFARSLDDAFGKALSALREGWDRYSRADRPDLKKVDFWEPVLASFLNDDPPSARGVLVSIENISRVASGYKLTLHGGWKGEITVGDDFKVAERFHRVAAK